MELRPGLELRVALMSRQHCHTASHTALMVWQAARPLAQLLLRCPAFFQCKAAASCQFACLLSSIDVLSNLYDMLTNNLLHPSGTK